ncbi:MAG: tetratricopeptide repeat protein [Bacteroidota bacterium]|nr:tetratricopeptide repeat protein [Bacteroidota bacterium]
MKSRHFIVVVLVFTIIGVSSGYAQQTAEQLYQSGLYKEEIKGELDAAIKIYETIINQHPDDRQVAAKTLYHLGLVNEKMGKQKANEYFTRLVNTYPDQTELVALAKARLKVLGGGTATTSSEVAMRRIWKAGNDWPFGISPDGKYVIFTAAEDNDIWLRDLQTGEKKRITRYGPTVEWMGSTGLAAISQDIKQIVFSWWNKSYGELRLSALDGSAMKLIHSGQDGISMYPRAWMPDNKRILAFSFDRRDNTYQRNIISLTDGSIKKIGQSDKEEFFWGYPSSDGRFIIYTHRGDIFVYNILTERDSILIQSPSLDKMIGWLPDGSGILFMSDRSGTFDLYILKIKNGLPTGEPQLVRRDIGSNTNLYLAREGKLFRIEDTGTTNSYISQIEKQSGRLLENLSPVDANYPDASYPTWSADGKLLYYAISKGPTDNRSKVLVVRSEETGQTREITPKPKFLQWYRPILSPDGSRFSVTGTGENMNFGVFAFNSENGEVSQLSKIPTENEPVDPAQNWSPDGNAIFYKVRSFEASEEFIIRRKDLVTGEEKDVNRGIHTMDMKISSDGTRFVYDRIESSTKTYVLGILDIQSGREHVLLRDSIGLSDPTWTPDGEHVLVNRSLRHGSELWRFPVAGGQGEKLYSSPFYCWGFVMHPSGNRVVFTQRQTNYELWVLENFLPTAKSVK